MSEPPSDLHRRYDAKPPRAARLAASLGGPRRRDRVRALAAVRQHESLARETRLGIARRRADLPRPEGDPWLDRLVEALAACRAAALNVRDALLPHDKG